MGRRPLEHRPMSKSNTSRPIAKADRRRAARAPQKKLAPAARQRSAPKKQAAPAAVAKAPRPPVPSSDAPGGKLGTIIAAVSAEAGATLAELAVQTGWQPHTTRAALCRLRQRGFAVTFTERDGRKAYRLTPQP